MGLSLEEWTLLVVAEAGGKELSPVQLQKALFLLGENLKPENFYDFRPYDYGPFSSEVYQDARSLAAKGLLAIVDPPVGYARYAATAAGIDHAAQTRSSLSEPVRRYVSEVVKWVRSLSFKQLVVAIYDQYPQMRENSIFRS